MSSSVSLYSFFDKYCQVLPIELCGTDWKIHPTFAVTFFEVR